MSKKIDEDAILTLFLENTKEYHVREVARNFKISPATAKKYLDVFVKQGLLTSKEERGHLLYEGNWNNEAYRFEKKLHNLRRIKESGLLTYLREELAEPTIILFGSWAKGENHETSDIDLFIRTEETQELTLEKYEKKLKANIQPFLYNRKAYEELRKNNKELLNNIINGSILTGYVELWDSRNTTKRKKSSDARPTGRKRKPSSSNQNRH
jgi:predicted nucleotidyltransferase